MTENKVELTRAELEQELREAKWNVHYWKEVANVREQAIRRQDIVIATLREVQAALIDERIGNVLRGYLIELETNHKAVVMRSLRNEVEAKIQAVEEVILRLKGE
jgi:hypothetical protein